jgi:hypothetical protein
MDEENDKVRKEGRKENRNEEERRKAEGWKEERECRERQCCKFYGKGKEER